MKVEEAFEKARRERERQLYAAGVSQLAVIEKEYGYLEIRAYPSLDAVVAASMLHSLLRRKGVRSWILVTPEPPREVVEPTVLLGFESSLAISLEFRAPSIVVARGERPQGLTRAALVAHRDASISALVAGMMSEILAVGDVGLLGLAAGYWLGLDRDKKGDFVGPEAWLAELFETENRVAKSLTLKTFDWFELSLEESIASTIDPLYPGLTGDVEAVKKLIERDEAAREALGRRVSDAPEEAVARVAELLYDLLKKSSRRDRRITEVVGVARYTLRLPVRDLRRLAPVTAAWLDARGVLATMPLASSLDVTLRLADAAYSSAFEATVEAVEKVLKNPGFIELRDYGPVKLCIHRAAPEAASFLIVAKQLRLLGLCPCDALVAVDTGTGIHALLDTAPCEVRHERIREALRRGCLRYIEDSVYAEARPC